MRFGHEHVREVRIGRRRQEETGSFRGLLEGVVARDAKRDLDGEHRQGEREQGNGQLEPDVAPRHGASVAQAADVRQPLDRTRSRTAPGVFGTICSEISVGARRGAR
jgi:hypothetical protein